VISNFFRRPPMAPSSVAKKNSGTSQAIMNMSNRSSNRNVSRASSTLSTVRRGIKSRASRSRAGSVNKPRGTNSLFRAISAENWDLVVELCVVKPYKAESWHAAPGFFDAHRSSTILPLHQACVFHPPKTALEHIIRAYPHATMCKESGYGRVPLHIACHSSASMEAIRALLQHCPTSSFEQDNLGRVPLHYALSNGSTIELVRELLISASEAGGTMGLLGCVSATDFNGWLPIHVACHMCATIDTLRILVQAFPDGVNKTTKKGSTPLELVKGLAVPEPKRLQMEAVLQGTEENPPPKDDLKRSNNCVSNLDEIGSVSVAQSREMKLDLDGDASSLSSMDTAQTGLTGVSKGNHSELVKCFSADAPQKQNYLPTHRVYSDLENASRSVASVPSDGFALGAGHAISKQQSQQSLQMGSISSQLGIRNSSSSSSNNDDAVSFSFQSVTPTAVFC